MAKLFGKKKKVASSSAAETATPLMAPANESVSTSRLSEGSREDRQKERAARREKREKRLQDSKKSEAASAASSSKKKKAKPSLSQEEQDARDANLGCCHHFAELLVKIIHFLDAALGLTLIIYGSLMLVNFENPAMEAVVTCLTIGSILLLASLFGIIGFKIKMCWRCGLVFSAFTAPLIAFFYFFVIIALLVNTDECFKYLEDHMDVMYLNQNEIDVLRSSLPAFYIVLAALSAVEITRFFALRKIRTRLLRYDAANKRISASSRKAESTRSDLTDPLIDNDDDEEDEGNAFWGGSTRSDRAEALNNKV